MKNWARIFLILFVFGLLIYANSLNNKFQMDDYFLLDHPEMTQTKYILSQWDPHSIKYFSGYYRPLAHMVYAFCYGTFENNYWQYHLFNLFLFVLLASLVYLLIRKLTDNDHLAFLSAVFFLIHPINGIMVNNIVTSALTFQVIFIIATILLLWESLERNKGARFYILSLLFSILSLFWYDMGVLTPVYLAAVILIFRKDTLRAKAMYLLPYFLISFFYLLCRSFFLNGTPFLTTIAAYHMTGWEYLATLFRLIMWYIMKLFFLQGIVMQWATPIVHKGLLCNGIGAFFLLMIFIFLFFRFRRERIIQVAVVWILIGFAPVCVVAFINAGVGALIEPHWLIFSSLGFIIIIANICLNILDRFKFAGSALLLGLVFIWSASVHAYNLIWADQKTYTIYWSKEAPGFKRPLTAMGDVYSREGNSEEARKYYQLGLIDNYSDPVAWSTVGAMDLDEGKLKEAEAEFKIALMINPNFVLVNNYLGVLYFKEGRWEKAEEYLTKIIDYDPNLLQPRRALVKVYLNLSQYRKAIEQCQKNLEISPGDPETLFLLIEIYVREKDHVALRKLAYTMISSINDPVTLSKLGAILTMNNLFDIAQGCYTKALHIDPNFKNGYLDEGTMFMRSGKYDAAIRIWQQGLGLFPSDLRFKYHIAKAMTFKSKGLEIYEQK